MAGLYVFIGDYTTASHWYSEVSTEGFGFSCRKNNQTKKHPAVQVLYFYSPDDIRNTIQQLRYKTDGIGIIGSLIGGIR